MRGATLAVIDVAVMGGLVAAIWFIVRNSRARRERIAEQLARDPSRSESRILVHTDWKATLAMSVFFGALGQALVRTVVDGKLWMAPLAAATTVSFCFHARRLVVRRPFLVVDGEGLTVRGRRTLRWDEVSRIELREPARFGVTYHELRLDVSRDGTPDTVAVSLEMLSPPWNDVVAAIQDRFGSRVVTAC